MQKTLRSFLDWRPLLLLLALLAAAVRPAQATHLLGGEMTYRYLDANGPAAAPLRYEITVTIYNNCNIGNTGIAAPNTNADIAFFNQATGAKIVLTTVNYPTVTDGGQTGIMNIASTSLSPSCITPKIPAGCTITGVSQPFRLQKFIGIVNLPVAVSGYYAVFTRAARNVDVTNLANPGNQALTLYATLAPPLIPNHSPVFSDTAVALICQGDTATLLNNAVDADGDRLVYAFGNPYGAFAAGNGTLPATFAPPAPLAPYVAGYAAATPFGSVAGNFASLNASTGIAKYKAGAASIGSKFVVAIDVSEYRSINGRDVLIGTTRRDLQLVVGTCPPTVAPVLPTVAATPRSYTIEEGQALSIPLTGTQAAGNPLTLTLNSILLDGAGGFNATFNGSPGTVVAGNPTGTATANGAGTVSGTFVYSSACGEARATPYDVAFTVKDNGCGGKTVADVLRITVTRVAGPTAISGDQAICDLTSVHTYTASGGAAPSVRWRVVGGTFVGTNVGSSVQVRWTTAGGGTIVAKGLSQYGCLTDSVVQSVNVAPGAALTVAGGLTICQGASTTLTIGGGLAPYTVTGGPTVLTGAGPFVVSPTATTTYTIASAANGNGCATTATATVAVVPLPAANVGAAARATCSGVPLTLGAAAIAGNTYSWSPATGLSSATVANPTATLTNPTGAPITQTYTLTETSATGNCQASNSVVITVNPLPVAAPGAAVVLCSGGSAQLGGTAVAGLSYSWSPATGLSSPTAANPTVTLTNTTGSPITTTYTLTVTNATTSCVSTGTVAVAVNPLPVVVPGAAVAICSGGAAQLGGAAVAGNTYSWSPATGLNSPTAANPTVTLINTTGSPITTTYTLTVTNATTTCVSTGTVAVTVNPLPVVAPGAAVVICSGGAAQLGGGAVAGLNYSWSPTMGLSSPTAANPTITLPNTTGAPITTTYTLTVTNAATSCVSSGTVVVTVNPLPVVVPGAAVVICSGGAAQLGGAAVAGLTYSWSPATGLNSPTTANPTVTLTNTTGAPITTTYTLTVTNSATGCVSTGPVAVTVNPLPVAVAGAAIILCSGGAAQLGGAAVAGFAYSWSPTTGLSSATVANPTITLTNTTTAPITTTYTLTVANATTGCVSTATVAVTVNPAATVSAGPAQAVCDGQTITLGSTTVAGYSYQWTPATNLSSATVARPVLTGVNTTAAPLVQKYVLRATTALGCFAKDSVLITINPRPATDSIAGPVSVCPTVTGIGYSIRNPRATTYQWTVAGGTIAGGQGTTAITVNWGVAGTGTVSVYATNALGCVSKVFTLPILINQRLQTVKPTGPITVCQADGPYAYQTLLVNGSSYAWQLFGTATGTLVNTLNTTSISFTQPGLAKLVVTQTSNPAGGICRGVSDTLYITVKPSPAVTLAIQGPARFCFTSGAVTYTLPGAVGSTYVFQLNGTTVAGVGNSVVIPASTAVGTYTLTARETNAGNCAGPLYTKQFIVDPLPGTIVINGPRFICPASGSLTYTVPNATAGSTFQWAVGGGTITAGQGTASITVSFPTGTTTNKTVSVTESSAFGCAGASVALTVVPDNAVAPVLTVASVDAQDNGKVNLTFAVANPQATPNPVRVLRRPASGTGPFAQVGTVAATATTYTDATASAAQTAYEYRLELTNGCGDLLPNAANATTSYLTAVATPGAGGRSQGSTLLNWSAYQGFTVGSYQVYQQIGTGGYALLATVGGTTLQAAIPNGAAGSATGAGMSQCYRVVALAPAGTTPALASNSNTACVTFASKLAFYNIITPNGDGQNDVLTIDNVTLYPGNSLSIFNRWGREVYTTTNYQNTWGSDTSVAAGTYYYLFKLADGSATKGWVEVVR